MVKEVKVERVQCEQCGKTYKRYASAQKCEKLDIWATTHKYHVGEIVKFIAYSDYPKHPNKYVIAMIQSVNAVRRIRKFFYRVSWNNHDIEEKDVIKVYEDNEVIPIPEDTSIGSIPDGDYISPNSPEILNPKVWERATYIAFREKTTKELLAEEGEGLVPSTDKELSTKEYYKLPERKIPKSQKSTAQKLISKIAKANGVSEEYVVNNFREFAQDL